jgi:hypothetical protein
MNKLFLVRKDLVLAIGTLLLVIACYQLAVKQTVQLWQLHRQLVLQAGEADGVSYQPDYLERKSRNLDVVLKRFQTDTMAFHNQVINNIALIAEKNGVRLKEVPDTDPSLTHPRFILQKLIFQGDYFALMRLLAELETTADIGVIRSVVLRRQSRSAEQALPVLEILLQAAR